MAFLLTRSLCVLEHYRLQHFKFSTSVIRHISYPKIKDGSYFGRTESRHQYSTVPYRKQILFLRNSLNSNGTFFSISSQHFMSTSGPSNVEVLSTDSLSKISDAQQPGVELATNKVLFIEESPGSSSPVFSDSEVLIDDATISFATDAGEVIATNDLLASASELVEPSLASLGLCNYTPVGFLQWCLECIHIGTGLPWWLSIVVATTIARMMLFPIFVKAQKNAAQMANVMPRIQFLQQKFNEARRTGNAFETTRLANEMMKYMSEHQVSPFKNFLIPMIQAPVFISFFLSLRSMAKLPVESLKTGGFSWITDLTLADPYYIMPLTACATLYIVLKVGAESGVRMENMSMVRYIFKALPFIAFPFTMRFQSAVLFYWCTNNFITLGMVGLLKIPGVREYFKIPRMLPPDPSIVKKKQGFIKGIKEAYNDQKLINSLDERKKIDKVRFQKAGVGPIPRTYAYDPTKPRPAPAAAIARQKESKAQ